MRGRFETKMRHTVLLAVAQSHLRNRPRCFADRTELSDAVHGVSFLGFIARGIKAWHELLDVIS